MPPAHSRASGATPRPQSPSRSSPIRATPTEVYEHGFHNADERLHIDDLAYAVRFHLEVAREIGALGR